jgi:hypothetical protein
MMMTESSWVFPSEFAAEAPFLISAYSSLTGFDVYYWFATGTEEWTPPQSANGYNSSQQKWICATPDCAALWPAAALAFRKGYIQRGKPAVVEHRPLDSIWRGDTPLITESPSFDPNRDATDIVPGAPVKTFVNPYAYFVGPVEVVYDSKASNTKLSDVDSHIQSKGKGMVIQSNTGELELNTADGYVTLNAPAVQGVTGHKVPEDTVFNLRDISLSYGNEFASIMAASLDGKSLDQAKRVLVQVGTPSRPTDWETKPAELTVGNQKIQGKEVLNYGRAPWQVEQGEVTLTIRNTGLKEAVVLDMNAMPIRTLALQKVDDGVKLTWPSAAMYVILQ